MERAQPSKNCHSVFNASHLLQLSTNRVFRVNGKQPVFDQISKQLKVHQKLEQVRRGKHNQAEDSTTKQNKTQH